MFHSYNNNPNYGYLGVQSVFKPFKAPEVEYVEVECNPTSGQINQTPVMPAKKKTCLASDCYKN